MVKYARIFNSCACGLIIVSFLFATLVAMTGCHDADDHVVPEEDPIPSVNTKQSVSTIQLGSHEADLFKKELEDFSERIVVRNGLFYVNESHVRNENLSWRWDAEFRAVLKERNKLIQQKSVTAEDMLFNSWVYLGKDVENAGQHDKENRTGDGGDRPWVQHYWWGSRYYIPHVSYSDALFYATIVGGGISFISAGIGYFALATASYLQYQYSMNGHGRGVILYAFGPYGGYQIIYKIEYPHTGCPPEEEVKELPPEEHYDHDFEDR